MKKTPTTKVRNAFTGFRGTYVAKLGLDGRVWVYDSVAGHYTTCHALTDAQIRYVRYRCKAG
jgi:hypothetical protein